MSLRQDLTLRFAQWQRSQTQRQRAGLLAVLGDSHACWMPRPNLYVEHDIGTKNVRYPNGRTRSVRVTKVRDTAGVNFLSLAPDTPLS